MRRIISFSLALIFLTLSQSVGQQRKANSDGKPSRTLPLSAADEDGVIRAILDEIYINNLQGAGFDAGKPTSDSAYQLNAYFKPTLNSNQVGWVIYKLMPYGEVYRMFSIRGDKGLAILYGKLRDHFPPTQPSYLTVYMDDDQLCQIKREWQKKQFVVELKPSADRMAKARARQQDRK